MAGPISNWIPFFGPLYWTSQVVINRHRLYDFVVEKTQQYTGSSPSQGWATWSFIGIAGPRIVCVVDPANLEYVLNRPDIFIKGARFQSFMHELLGHGIFNTNGHQWLAQRKLASKIFTNTYLKNYMFPLFEAHTHYLLPFFERAAQDQQQGCLLDVQDVFMRFTMDCFSEISGMGAVHSLLQPQPFAKAFDTAQLAITERFTNPSYLLLGPSFLAPLILASEKAIPPAIRTIDQHATQIIRRKKQQETSTHAHSHLSHHPQSQTKPTQNQKQQKQQNYLNNNHNDDSDDDHHHQQHQQHQQQQQQQNDLISRYMELDPDMDTTYLRDAVTNFLLAGRDTTAVCLSWTLYELAKNPHVHDALEEEVVSVIGRTATPSHDQLMLHMPYLKAVVSETLRLHPSVPWDPKETVSDTQLPGGQFVPQASVVSWVAYATGRDPHLWPSPELYNPLRWIDPQKHNGGVEITQYAFPAFQPGRRSCLGKKLAYAEVSFVLASLCQAGYRFQIPASSQVGYTTSITLLTRDLKLIVTRPQHQHLD